MNWIMRLILPAHRQDLVNPAPAFAAPSKDHANA
jgi:hypothetical protein